MNEFHLSRISLITFILIMLIAGLNSCTNTKKSYLKPITSTRQLEKITTKAKDHLLMLGFFDERCMSCYMLFTQLEEIAKEQKGRVTIYAINVTQNPEIAKPFSLSGTPYVVIVKNRKNVHTISGRQDKEAYVSVIERFAD